MGHWLAIDGDARLQLECSELGRFFAYIQNSYWSLLAGSSYTHRWKSHLSYSCIVG